jgi:outer membrane immunogenic protein
MKLLSGILGLTLSTVAAFVPARAAEIPNAAGTYSGPVGPVPAFAIFDWSGFYVGVNGGGAWAPDNQLTNALSPFGGISPSGGFGGGQIGYNWQGWWERHLVLGIEADIQGSGISDEQTDFNGFHYKSNLDYFGTVRGRVGYAVQQTLFYFTGGLAYGGLHKFSDAFGPQSFDGTAAGYTVGAGVEYKVTPVWSVKGEFQYMNFGQNNACGSGSCFNAPFNAQPDDDYATLRVGVNYHFLPIFEPLK